MIVQDQKRAIDMVSEDVNLKTLEIVQAPLFDLEIRGVPALKFMGDLVWR
jgi:arsenite-transporting ATPase